jgi:hypothetical protein
MRMKIIALAILLLGAAALQAAKGGGGGSPTGTTSFEAPPAQVAKPEIKLPLSPNSTNVAAQLFAAGKAAARLGPPAALAALKIETKAHVLPPRPEEVYDMDVSGKKIISPEYDWKMARVIGDRYWLLSNRSMLVSAPGNMAKWEQVHHFPLTTSLLDVFEVGGSTYLLSSDWLVEMSPDGKQMLRVVHLAPKEVTTARNLSYLSGGSLNRTDPMNFVQVTVWRDTAWIGNSSEAWFKFSKLLAPVSLKEFGGRFTLLPMEDELFAFGKPLTGQDSQVMKTNDGKKWSQRQKYVSVSPDELAGGNGRMVKLLSGTFEYSTDGLVWHFNGTQPLPEVRAEFESKEGSYNVRTNSGRWSRITFADGLFVAVGAGYQAGKRYPYSGQEMDAPVAGVSFDGLHWRTFPLAVKYKPRSEWVVTGSKGHFLASPRHHSSEVVEINITSMPAQPENHPSFAKGAELRAEMEAAAAKRDGRTVAARLMELENYFPSESNQQLEVLMRAQMGDVDGAWNRIEAVDRNAPGNLETEALRPFVLLAARRAAEGQAYAAWLLQENKKEFYDYKVTSETKLVQTKLQAMAGQLREAIATGELLADREKKNAEVRVLLGSLHLQNSNKNSAKRRLTEAAELGDVKARQMLESPEFK